MTMLVGAARLLAARRSTLHGSVVFMFQPGEEGYFGARHMIDAGVLEAAGARPVGAYALHVAPGIVRGGEVATRPGPLLAATDRLRVDVVGASGHGARPHLALDPVPVAAEIVLALQTAITRRFDVFDPVVLSVGAISAGTEHNVIADSARLEATIRTFSAAARAQIADVVTRVCDGIALAHGLRAETAVEPLYPATVNDSAEAARIERVAAALFGAEQVHRFDHPMPGSEDFSMVLEAVPGAMAFFGVCPPDRDPATAPYNHSTRVVHDESRLADGAALLAALALDRLADRAPWSGESVAKRGHEPLGGG
jgi:hippurate hydrolase